MNEKSLLDLAFEIVSNAKGSVNFKVLWKTIVKEKGLSAEEADAKVSQFYTTLLLDGRFVNLGDNVWDLRSRHTFDKVHIDMKDVYSDVETSDDDEEEVVDEKQYNDAFEEKVVSRDDEIELETTDEDSSSDENL